MKPTPQELGILHVQLQKLYPNTELIDLISDLLTDLQHLAEHNQLDYKRCINLSNLNFKHERSKVF